MSQSLRAVLVLVFLTALLTAAISWMDGGSWRVRGIATGVTLLSLFLLLRAEFKSGGAPDFLKEHFGSYYERDGFCFVVGVAEAEGESVLRVFFQNRYQGDCEALVVVRPQRLRIKMPPMPALSIPVQCPGGAFGKSEVLWPIPADWQGAVCLLEIFAASRFPNGRGPLIRHRGGMDVAKARDGVWGAVASLTTMAFAGLPHALLAARGTRIKVRLPSNTAVDGPGNHGVHTEIFWMPGGHDENAEPED